jgi:chaperonin GroEL
LSFEYVDMFKAGLSIRPKLPEVLYKMLQALRAMFLTTEASVAEIPKPEAAMPAGGGMGGGMPMM